MHLRGALGVLAREAKHRFLFGLAWFSLHFRLRRNGAGCEAQCRYATLNG
jgi:hypothetical protein